MDSLTRFPQPNEVTLTGDELVDTVNNLERILEQLKMTRLGHELYDWGQEVEAEDV